MKSARILSEGDTPAISCRNAIGGASDAVRPGERASRDEPDPFFAATTFNGGPMELADSPRVALARKEWKELEKSLPPEPPMASGVRDGADRRIKKYSCTATPQPSEPGPSSFPTVYGRRISGSRVRGSGRLSSQMACQPGHPLTLAYS